MGSVSAGHARAWREKSQRGVVVRQGGRADSREVSQAALSAAAVYVLSCVSQLSDRCPLYEGTLHGLPGRSESCGYSGRVYVWTSIPGGSSDGARCDTADSLSAGGL